MAQVVTTLRQSYTASKNELSACIYDGQTFYHSQTYEITPMRDRVGGGDAFSAGMIAALLERQSSEDAVEFALAASVLKHTIPGDYNLSTREEIVRLQKGKVHICR